MLTLTRIDLPPCLRIAGLYLLAGSTWILLSATLLSGYRTLQGLSFILASSLLIGLLVHRNWQALRRSEHRFQALVEHAGDIISVIDRDGTRKYHSPALEQVLGYRPKDLIENGILDYVQPDDQLRAQTLLAEIASYPETAASLDLYQYQSINVMEVAGGILVRATSPGGRNPEALEFQNADFPHMLRAAFSARGETNRPRARSKLLPTGYEDFLRSVGYRLDRQMAAAISVTELQEFVAIGGVGTPDAQDRGLAGIAPFQWLM